MFAAIIGIAKADIKASIEVKDSNPGNSIDGQTVPVNTVAYVFGHYEDLSGNTPASAIMEVYFDDGSGWAYRATLFSGTVNDGETIIEPYTMTELGYYEFRWTCEKAGAGTSGMSIFCRQERAQARTTVQLVIPEPGTLAGLIMALSALAFLAVKELRIKQ